MAAPLLTEPADRARLLALCDWATGGPLPAPTCGICEDRGCEFCPAVKPDPLHDAAAECARLIHTPRTADELVPLVHAPSDYARLARLVRELAATRGMGWVLEVTGEALSDVYCQPRDATR